MTEHVAVRTRMLQAIRIRAHRSREAAPGGAALRRAMTLVILVCAGVLMTGVGAAQAFLEHTITFGSQGSAGGQFTSPQGVAVDNTSGASSGDVYVVDAGNFRVEKFDASGNFLLAFGKGVDKTTPGDVCTHSSGDTCGAGTQGTSAGEFQAPLFVAVDSSTGASAGDVYVGDEGSGSGSAFISKYDSGGNLITTWGSGGQLSGSGTFGTIDGITVDKNGNLLVINDSNQMFEFAQDGSAITNFATTRGMDRNGLDVNTAGDIFKVNGDSSVEKLTSNGTDVGQVNQGSTQGLVIDRSTGDMYVNAGSNIQHDQFDASGNVIETSGTNCTPGNFSGCPPTETFGTVNGGTGVGFDYSGSMTNTLYVAEGGANDVEIYTTPTPGPPQIDSEFANQVGSTYATVNAEINPFGNSTTCQFQYVTDAQFQVNQWTSATTVNCSQASLGSTFEDKLGSANLTGLTINTKYDFRVIATNSAGTVNGNPATFTTLGPASIDSESASNIGSSSADLNTQINPLGTDTTCQFQYVTDAQFQVNQYTSATTVNCNPMDLGNGKSDVSATAHITGLQPGTTYHFHAVASNTLGTVTGTDQTFQTSPPLIISGEAVSNVTDTSATVKAQINPEGTDTTYVVQYVSDAKFDPNFTQATTVPLHPVDVGSGTSFQPASLDLTGLSPSTTYHWRFVGHNAVGTENGDAKSFTTYASNLATGLPDKRAYEMVTPPNKDNGEPFARNGLFGPLQAANNGNAVSFFSFNAYPGSVFDGHFYLSNRGTKSWITQNPIPPQATELGLLCAAASPEMVAYNADLSTGILEDGGSLIGTCGADVPPLVPGEPQGAQNLFVRNNATNTYQLVNVTPGGVTPSNATFDAASADMSHVVFDENAKLTSNAPSPGDDLYDWSGGTVKLATILPNGTPVVGTLAGGSPGNAFHAVSADGSMILFTANNNLYLRKNGTSTVQVDAVHGGSGAGGGGQFLAATADGSKVFFMDDASAGLTSNTVSGSGANLYEYDGASGNLTDLTPVSQAQVQGLSGITDDGSSLYFVANGSLASGATAGQPNLYLLHGGTMTFVDTLSSGFSDSCNWSPGQLCARVSSNGAFLAFTSTNNLTPFDSGGRQEIYRYDAGAKQVTCASCNPSGVAPSSDTSVHTPFTPLFGSEGEYLQHYVSDSGQVFFDTTESLLPTDNNGTSDVYEYENGQLHLLSSGKSPDPSLFIDSSPNGNDAFFTTSDQLVPQDGDGAVDIYDARVGGGFPASAPAPACVGETCKPPPSAIPPVPVVASVNFFGPGNVRHVRARVHLLRGDRVALRVRVPGRGVVSASGRDVRSVRGKVTHAGVYTVILHLDRRAMAALKHKRKLRLTIRVRYVRAGRPASVAIVKLTVDA